jgi:hypothetical protein
LSIKYTCIFFRYASQLIIKGISKSSQLNSHPWKPIHSHVPGLPHTFPYLGIKFDLPNSLITPPWYVIWH